METNCLHFITIITIFTVAFLFCISRTTPVSSMKADAAAKNSSAVSLVFFIPRTTPVSAMKADSADENLTEVSDSPSASSPSPYSDQQEVHQALFNPLKFILLQPVLMNLDGFLEFPGVAAVNPSLSGDSVASTTVSTIEFEAAIATNSSVVSDSPSSLPYSDQQEVHRELFNPTSTENSASFIYLVVLFGAVGIVVLCFFFVYCCNYNGIGRILTLEEIAEATDNFSNQKLIKHGHSGVLYKGILDHTLVVIKRIDVGSSIDMRGSYMTELKFFKSKASSHKRLVSVVGHCLNNENEKFLVYNRMSSGDLYNYSLQNLQSLSFSARAKIAVRVAEGLHHLHHRCCPPLVHRDVRASSILLDDNNVPFLGSFSKVCAREWDNVVTRLLRWLRQTSDEQDPSTMHQLLDTSSSPPATCSHDVYCFGKILLGLLTGNLEISESSSPDIDQYVEQTESSISLSSPESLRSILDPTLDIDDYILDDVWGLAILAKLCLDKEASKRPPMTYVLKVLKYPRRITGACKKTIRDRLMEAGMDVLAAQFI